MSKQLQIATDFTLPIEAVTQTFGILAKRGVGKTHTACVMIEEMLEAKLPVAIVDPVGVWWGLRSSKDGKKAGYPIFIFGGEHGDMPLDKSAGKLVADTIVEQRVPVVIDLSLMRKGEQSVFMTDFCEQLYRKNRQALHLVLDEADAFAPQRPLPGQQRMLGAVEDIVRRGRARGLGVTLITQRAAVINKDVLTQIEVLISLRMPSPQDRKAVDDWIRAHGTEEERKVFMESLASLPIGTAWFWSPGWLQVFQKIHVRDRRTFDSSATPKVGEKQIQPRELSAVDIDKLRAEMEKLAAPAKKPGKKTQDKTTSSTAQDKTVYDKQLQEADQRGYEHGVEVGKRLGYEEAAKAFRNKLFALDVAMEQIHDIASRFEPEHVLPCDQDPDEQDGKTHVKRFSDVPAPKTTDLVAPALTDLPPHIRIDKKSRDARRVLDNVANATHSDLKPALQKVIDAIAWWHAAGKESIERARACVVAGYSPRASTFGVYIAELAKLGYVDVSTPGKVALTDAGRAIANMPDAPTPEQLRNMVRDLLKPQQMQVFNVVCGAWPNEIHRHDVANQMGLSPTASTTGVYIAQVAAFGFVETSSPGHVRAADWLFETKA